MSRMFKSITRTWNPFTGCLFGCTYCWARALAEGKLRHLSKYHNGFSPTFHENELRKKFKPGEFVFVSDMGDVAWIRPEWRMAIADVIARFPDTRFLVQSKDPFTFMAWPDLGNIYWGTTIETNRDYDLYSDFCGHSSSNYLLGLLA